jgi:Prophage CP4-57 regulatory protein (AlpA)
MEQLTSPFVLPDEADKISLVCDLTRRRQEKLGRFPERIKLANRKIAYLRSAIDDWARDPEGWRTRNASQRAAS